MKYLLIRILLTVLPLSTCAQQQPADSLLVEQSIIYYSPRPDTAAKSVEVYSDTIITVEGEVIHCRITEVSPDLTYFKLDSLRDAICVLTTESIFVLRYSNGTFDLGADLLLPDYYEMGRSDGKKYYKTRDAVVGSVISGALYWVMGAGVITGAAIIASKPHDIRNPENPNDKLLENNQDYYNGYMKGARKKKIRHTSIGFVSGVGGFTLVIFILIAAAWGW